MYISSITILLFTAASLFLTINIIALELIHVNGIKFDPIPFDKIPTAIITSENGKYKLSPDFSIDYGDEPVIIKNNDSKPIDDMILDKKFNGSNLQLECDSNDECGSGLAPTIVKIYLVDGNTKDEDISENSNSTLELGINECGNRSIKDCANFNFIVPGEISLGSYKAVIDMSFDEAKWIFINPVKVLE